MFNHLYLTLGEALTAVSFLGLLAGAPIGAYVVYVLCDRHSDTDYEQGKVDGYAQALERMLGGPAAPRPVDSEPDGDSWAAELAAINRDLAPFPAPRAAQIAPGAPALAPVDGESTFVQALRLAPLERVGDVFDGYRPPPDRPSWVAVNVRRLIHRAAGQPKRDAS